MKAKNQLNFGPPENRIQVGRDTKLKEADADRVKWALAGKAFDSSGVICVDEKTLCINLFEDINEALTLNLGKCGIGVGAGQSGCRAPRA